MQCHHWRWPHLFTEPIGFCTYLCCHVNVPDVPSGLLPWWGCGVLDSPPVWLAYGSCQWLGFPHGRTQIVHRWRWIVGCFDEIHQVQCPACADHQLQPGHKETLHWVELREQRLLLEETTMSWKIITVKRGMMFIPRHILLYKHLHWIHLVLPLFKTKMKNSIKLRLLWFLLYF